MSDNDSRRESKIAAADAPEPASSAGTGRRDFLRYAGFSFAAVALPDWLSGCGSQATGGATREAIGTARSAFDPVVIDTIPGPWFTAVRRDDLLRLRFTFLQMTVSGKQVALDNASQPGVILVEFPPQHVFEQTFNEPDTGAQPAPGARPIDARIAQPSRLAFYVPAGTPALPFDLEALLQQCTQLDLNTAANAVPAADDKVSVTLPSLTPATSADQAIHGIGVMNRARQISELTTDSIPADNSPPSPTPPAPGGSVAPSETSIELPYRLMLSPSFQTRFAHSSTAVQSATSSRTELWTSRLARVSAVDNKSADETTRVPISVRAVATADLGPGGAVDPFAPTATDPVDHDALQSRDRLRIVAQTSDFTTSGATYPIHARQMFLSARGGTLDVLADFEFPKTSLKNWEHRASIGRDNYVRIEDIGFLFPWNHTASLVTISERKFLPNPNNGPGPRTAYLWKRQFILIRQPVMDYRFGAPPITWPFTQVKILTPSSPPIDPAPAQPNWFWPTVGGYAVQFAAQFVDLEDNVLNSTLTAIWVPQDSAFTPDFTKLQGEFQTATDPNTLLRCKSDFRRQGVAYAPTSAQSSPSTVGKTTFETRLITFGAFLREQMTTPPPPPDAGAPPPPPQINATRGDHLLFTPNITQTQVALPSIRQFTGDDTAINMEYATPYTTDNNGFLHNNPGEVFLQLVGNSPLQVNFGAQSQRAGAFLTPNMAVLGLSRQVGPVAGNLAAATSFTDQITNLANGATDPSLLFGGLPGTMLFGCFTLGDLFGKNINLGSMPKFAHQMLDTIATVVKTVNQAQLAVQQIQNIATSAQTTLNNDLNNALNQLNAYETSVSNFVTAIGNLPPDPTSATNTPQQFISNAQSALGTITTALNPLQTALSQARATNAKVPLSAQLPDSLFGSADAFLRQAKAMLGSGALPQGLIDAINAIANAENVVQNLTSHIDWSTSPGDIKPIDVPTGSSSSIPQVFFPSDGVDPKFPQTQLKISGEVRAHEVAGKPAGLDLTATLNNFDINLVGVGGQKTDYNHKQGPQPSNSPLAFMTLSFDHLTFTMMAGQKPNIDVGFHDITFQGPVQFLNGLKDIIPLNGFSDPPGITVDSQGIHGDFTVALPALGLGVFSLENLSVGADFSIPFIGQPMTVGFHFSERQNPFHLTVSLLGGGGYFLMDLSLQGVQLIEAALEFGAEASIDLVVASGSVLIMAGIYFRYDASAKPDPGVQLTGYVRIAGSMSVIGLITASVELRMDLGYKDGNAFGEATISIEVSIMFFSASVDVHAEKSFSSSNGDPTFLEVMCPGASPNNLAACSATGTAWDEYCHAFAA
jgi:hypothetical protein